MTQFSLFSFFILVLVSQVLARRHKTESEDYVRGEPGFEVAKKRYSFAVASLDEAQHLNNFAYMRRVLKGIALDLASLRTATRKILGSLERLNENSEPSPSEQPSETNPLENRLPQLFGSSLSGDSIYPYPMNPQLNTQNAAENIGSPLENNPYSSPQQNPFLGYPQPQTYQQFLSGKNGGLPQLSENMGQLPNKNVVFQRK